MAGRRRATRETSKSVVCGLPARPKAMARMLGPSQVAPRPGPARGAVRAGLLHRRTVPRKRGGAGVLRSPTGRENGHYYSPEMVASRRQVRRTRRPARHEGPPSLRHAPGIVVLPPLVGATILVSGVQTALGANGVGRLLLGLLVAVTGAAMLVLMTLHYSGFWWRRRHRVERR